MARRKTNPESEESEPTFEAALAGLESIVEEMEHEHLALEDLVDRYEKGSAYLTRCEAILRSARERIELITLRNQKEISLDADAKSPESPDFPAATDLPDDSDDDNDIRLF